jgi:hypothetical protein
MGFFIDETKKERIYFDENMNVVEKETEFWVEIRKEPSYATVDQIRNAIKPKNVKMNSKTNEITIDTENMAGIDLKLLIGVIEDWSAKEPKHELAQKGNPTFIKNLWKEILERYNIGLNDIIQ